MKVIKSFSGEFDFLSNFFPCELTVWGITFPTLEHAYQAAKFPMEERQRIANLRTPGAAKREGRKANLPADWELTKVNIMLNLVVLKFSHPELAKKLTEIDATGGLMFIEGNTWHDNFWGSCCCPRCEKIMGENKLGLILSAVRNRIIIDAWEEVQGTLQLQIFDK